MYITILVKQVYWYITQVSGERLQDRWSSGIALLIAPRRYFCCGSIYFMYWCQILVLFDPYVRFHNFSSVMMTEWLPIGK